jgi:CubicO group peptidase (beta-lactamase class C family)
MKDVQKGYIQEHILGPLGMTDTSVNLSPDDRKRLAAAYSRRLPDGTRRILPFTDSRGLTPAANMSSTVEDLARFISLQFRDEKAGGKQVLKRSTLREMHRVHWLFPSWKSGRGLGFSVRQFEGKTLVGHSGWVAGYQTQIGFIVEDRIGVIVLTNADDGSPNTYLEQAFNVVGPAILKAAAPAPKPSPPDPAWNAYIGLYSDPTFWDVEVMLLDGKLYLYNHDYPPEENARGALVELVPESPRTFRMTGEDASGDLVVFEMDPDGKVQRVKVGENYIFPKK